jgi:hypothetical protein
MGCPVKSSMRKLLIVGDSHAASFFIGMASEIEYAEVGTWQNSLRITSSNCWLLEAVEAVWTQPRVQMKLLISSHDVGSQLDQSDVCPSNREGLHWALQVLVREPVEPQRPDILWLKL